MSKLFFKSSISISLALLALLSTDMPALAQSTAAHSLEHGQAGQLADLAFGYAIAEQPEKAISLLDQAATYEGGGCYEANVWLKVGAGYRAAGQVEKGEAFLTQAYKTAIERDNDVENCFTSGTTPSESLLNRSREYVESGHLDLALHIAEGSDNYFSPMTMVEIAGNFYEAGQPRKAKQIIMRSVDLAAEMAAEEGDDPLFTLMPLSGAAQLSKEGNPQLATFLIEESGLLQKISSPEDLIDSNIEVYQRLSIAGLLADLDKPEQSLSVIDEATSNVLPAEGSFEAVHSWVGAAVLYSQLGSDQRADDAFAAANASLEGLSGQAVGIAQTVIVNGYAELGKFEQATQLASAIESSNESTQAYSDIAAAYAQAGEVEEANRVASSIGQDKFTRLSMIRAYLSTEQYDQAQQIATQPDMIDYLPEIGQAYCAAGQAEQVVSLIELLASNLQAADWLRSCAATEFAKQQQFDRATAIADTITSPEYRADTLIAIAAQYDAPASSFWAQWVQRIANPLQTLLGSAPDSSNAVQLLDEAHELIQR